MTKHIAFHLVFIKIQRWRRLLHLTLQQANDNGHNNYRYFCKPINMDKSFSSSRLDRSIKFDYVPEWFINLIPIELRRERYSEISNGWTTSAIIYVSANAGDAYAKLYEQAKKWTYLCFNCIYAISMVILLLVFRSIFIKTT